jgi:23S rRNA pseudouridine1911/1915/1917 synthase
VYKPVFWLTHAVSEYQSEASLEDWLIKKELIPADIPNNGRVHRLDRNTSGIILYAKTEEAQEELKSLFQARKITKTYVALVEGHLEELSSTIKAAIIRKKGSFKRIIAEDASAEGAKDAETSYRVIARSEEYDLLLVTPKTGRTHQIRVHMEHLGHPLVGDTLYGGEKTLLERQFLHALTLNFSFQGEKYAFQAPLAKDLKNALLSLDERTLTRYDNEALQSMGLKPANAFFSLFKGIYSKNR